MSLKDLTVSLLKMVSKTTTLFLIEFFEWYGKNPITKQSYSEARGKLNHGAIKAINYDFIDGYYEKEYKTYKGNILLSVDASGISLPISEEIREHFGCPSNQNQISKTPVGNGSYLYDLENEIIINGVLRPYAYSEREMLFEHIRVIRKIASLKDKKIIVIMDRGYPSIEVITGLLKNKIDFIILSPKDYIKETRIASEKLKYDSLNKIKISNEMKRGKERVSEYIKEKGDNVEVRIVTGNVTNEKNAVFITSLKESEFKSEEILSLYKRRWEIEVLFRKKKGTVELENFACKTVQRLKQEFYGKIITMNFSSIIVESAQEELDNKVKQGEVVSKYQLKINENIAYGIINSRFLDIISSYEDGSIDENFSSLISLVAQHYTPIIPDRHFPRSKNTSKKKHNIVYRRAL